MKMKKIIKCIILFFIVFLLTTNVAFAYYMDGSESDYMNGSQFDTYTSTGKTGVVNTAIEVTLGSVLTVIRTIAACLALIVLLIMGIQYMTAVPEMKGEIKKKQPLYITGAILLFASSGVLQLITYFIQDTL